LIRKIKIGSSAAPRLLTSETVVCGEHVAGLNIIYSNISMHAVEVDERRHESLGYNILWLDFHVDNTLPKGRLWDVDDPWAIPKQ
jgi:prepilin-type processing-associated H-X9-DG protein